MVTELSEMPSDILNEAAQAVERMPHRLPFKADVMEAIARAILAERERCAELARSEGEKHNCLAQAQALYQLGRDIMKSSVQK